MENTKDDNKQAVNTPKRRSVKTLVTGASVVAGASFMAPKAWKKPVVDSIVLPAHAQMTATTTIPPVTTTSQQTTPPPPTTTQQTTPPPPTTTQQSTTTPPPTTTFDV